MMEQAHPANRTYDFPVAPLPTMPPPPRVPFGGQLVTLNNQFGNRTFFRTMQQFYLIHMCTGNLVQNVTNTARNADLSEEDLLLASTTVYGFSLSDKVWCKYLRTHLVFCALFTSAVRSGIRRRESRRCGVERGCI